MKTPSKPTKLRAEYAFHGKFVTEIGGPAAENSKFGIIVKSPGMKDEWKAISKMLLSGSNLAINIDPTANRVGCTLMAFTEAGFWVVRVRVRSEDGDGESGRPMPIFRALLFPGFLLWRDLPRGLIATALLDDEIEPPVMGDPPEIAAVNVRLGDVDKQLSDYFDMIDKSTLHANRFFSMLYAPGTYGTAMTILKTDFGHSDRSDIRRIQAIELEALRLGFATEDRDASFPIILDASFREGEPGISLSERGIEAELIPDAKREFDAVMARIRTQSGTSLREKDLPRTVLYGDILRTIGTRYPLNLAPPAADR